MMILHWEGQAKLQPAIMLTSLHCWHSTVGNLTVTGLPGAGLKPVAKACVSMHTAWYIYDRGMSISAYLWH
jgi:hypothetical protein